MPVPLEPDFTEAHGLSVQLPSSPTVPWLARQLLAQWCHDWRLAPHVVDDSMVVVSELVTESVGAGAESVTIGATVGETELEVSVSAVLPPTIGRQASSPDDATVPRADVLEGLSDRVEVRNGEQGRTVVVAIPLSRAP